MIQQDFQIAVERRPYPGTFALYGRAKHEGGKSFAKHVTMQTVTPENEFLCEEPFLELREADAQYLLNELWNAGLRPADVGSEGERQALKQARDWAQRIAQTTLELMTRGTRVVSKKEDLDAAV